MSRLPKEHVRITDIECNCLFNYLKASLKIFISSCKEVVHVINPESTIPLRSDEISQDGGKEKTVRRPAAIFVQGI